MRRTSVPALALGVVLLFDALRVWLPSVIFVYGRAGTTPATEMGLFAVLPFLVALVAAVALRRIGAPALVLGGAGVAALARLGLQATAGGDPQLWLSTAAVAALLVWIVGTAGTTDGRTAALGVVTGLAADAAAHTVLRSTGLAWREGVPAWLAVAVLCGAFVVAQVRADPREASATGPRLGWVGVGAVLVVHGILSGPVSRVHAVTGWSEWVAAAVLVGGHLIAVVVAVIVAGGFVRRGGLLALGVPVALGLALAGGPFPAAVGHLLLPACLAAAVAAGLLAGERAPAGRALAAGGALLLFIVLSFGYYAAYDLALPFPNDAMVGLAALVAVVVGLVGRGRVPAAPPGAMPAGGPGWALPTALAGVLVAIVGLVALTASPGEATAEDGFPLRVFNYNVQMGFDVDGRHAVARQADLLAAQDADVVALQEVSRGWLLNASTDVLPPIAERLGMPWVFAPAADRAWGNAILARHPILDSGWRYLPRLDSAMQRSVVWAVLDVSGAELAVVATHLQHVAGESDVRRAQAEVVAGVVRTHVEAGRPVVLMGDMNAEPGAPELAAFEGLLVEVSGAEGPVATWPSWAPDRHIDHVYVTPDLTADEVVVPASTVSDHLGVGVTIQP